MMIYLSDMNNLNLFNPQNPKTALERYPKCNLPIQIRVQSVVKPTNRLPLYKWFLKIYEHES